MLPGAWLSRYGLLENFNASVTRMHTQMRTGTWTTVVTAIALCTSCIRAKKVKIEVRIDGPEINTVNLNPKSNTKQDIQAATRENQSSGFLTRSDTNRPVQSQKQARSLKFRI